jgi:hypothetical protein
VRRPFAASAGLRERRERHGHTTNASPTVTGASGTWAIGDLIAGTNIPADTYVSNVVGATLTLAKTKRRHRAERDRHRHGRVALQADVPGRLPARVDERHTDCQFPEINVHGAKTAGVLLDSAWGNRVSGDSGFAIGGYNLHLADSFTLGCFENKIDLRLEQATKHNARIDNGCYDNTLLVTRTRPACTSAADADGGWANVVLRRQAQLARRDRLQARRPALDALSGRPLRRERAVEQRHGMTGGSELVGGHAAVRVQRGRVLVADPQQPDPGAGADGAVDRSSRRRTARPVSATFNTVHKVLSFADATSDEAVAYVNLPDGARNFKFTVFMVNLNSGVSGNVRVQLGFAMS